MECVYASPEMMEADRYKEATKLEGNTYPFLHAVDDAVEDDTMMQEVYGGPDPLLKSVGSSGKYPLEIASESGINDIDETIQSCRKCGKAFALRLTVCPFCGTIARETIKSDLNEDSKAITSCVYASPKRIGTGFVDKIIFGINRIKKK